MKSITIHVGLPKTATTSLQEKVFAAHPDIRYLGPKADYPVFDEVMAALSFAESLNYEAARSAQIVKGLLSSLRSDEKPLVSSYEALTAQGRDRLTKAERLKALFPDARIVITLRRPEDMVVSIYFQWLKGFGGKRREAPSLASWLEEDWRDSWKGNFLRLQYARVVDLYRSLFGVANVLILFFEDLVSERPKFARQLSSFIGVDEQATVGLLAQEKSNPRMTLMRYSEVRLYANFPVLQRLERFKRVFPDSVKVLVKNSLGHDAQQELTPEWRERIRVYARAENQALAREFAEIANYDYF